jgi:hypothetical protein
MYDSTRVPADCIMRTGRRTASKLAGKQAGMLEGSKLVGFVSVPACQRGSCGMANVK